jgi:hypothetical protein
MGSWSGKRRRRHVGIWCPFVAALPGARRIIERFLREGFSSTKETTICPTPLRLSLSCCDDQRAHDTEDPTTLFEYDMTERTDGRG